MKGVGCGQAACHRSAMARHAGMMSTWTRRASWRGQSSTRGRARVGDMSRRRETSPRARCRRRRCSACMAWDRRGTVTEGQGRRRPRKEDTRKHTRDVHCILDIVDVGCDTRAELAPKYIPEPKNWQSHGKCMAWHGTARRCGCACAFWGNLNLAAGSCQDGCQGPKAWGKSDQNNPRTPKRFPRVLTSRLWSNQKWDQIVSDTAGAINDKHKHQPI